MFLTAAILKSKRACEGQLALFVETFPDGVEVTPEACAAVADKFDFAWAADHLLPKALRAEYSAKTAPLWAEYLAKTAPLWAEYEAKRAPLWAEFDAEAAPLRAEYRAKLARAFGEMAVRA